MTTTTKIGAMIHTYQLDHEECLKAARARQKNSLKRIYLYKLKEGEMYCISSRSQLIAFVHWQQPYTGYPYGYLERGGKFFSILKEQSS